MTTAGLKNDQLPNNSLEVFKSNTKLVKASDGLFICSLKLPDGSSITIPMREDGYINVTKLCKAGGKEYKHWKANKESEAVIKAIERSVGKTTPNWCCFCVLL